MNKHEHDIVFNEPAVVGRELEYVQQSIADGYTAGCGDFTERCERLLERIVGAPRAILTTSCTASLEMSALLLDLEPGDEVIVPAFGFVTTASAFALRGARPVFADIRPDTFNLDEAQLAELVGDRTRAVVVMHYGGVACEMEAIGSAADDHGLAVIEDNAHGLFASYRGRSLGSFGRFATQSFHETKNLHCGEGGALLINDPSLIARAEVIRDKGTDRQRLFRGEVDKYTWVDLGSSYALSDMLAAFLLGQLESRVLIQQKRRRIWEYYDQRLRGTVEEYGVTLPVIPPGREIAHHLYSMLLPSLERRSAFIAHMRAQGILSPFHYTPLNCSRMAHQLGAHRPCPTAERVSETLVRLPFFYGLTEAKQDRVVEELLAHLRGAVG